ncbi:hypothetical protein H4R19_003254, partial [Coemansia spiralis]
SDSDFSGSEASAMFPEHAAERSGSTLFSPLHWSQSQLVSSPPPPKPLPVPPPSSRGIRLGFGSRKPAPMFEFGSARITYGAPAAAAADSQGLRSRTGSMPLTHDPAASSTKPPLRDRWQTAFREPARGWPAPDADTPLSAGSTESFCIITRVLPPQQQQQEQQPTSDSHSRTQAFT